MAKPKSAGDMFARVFDLGSAADAAAQPIIRLTDLILEEALNAGAARVHVAPLDPNFGSVRWFVQGDWQEVMKVPVPGCSRVVNRLKIMGNLDISKKGRQEGTVHLRVKGHVVHLPLLTNVSPNNTQEAFLDCPPHG